jgi:hypothetical protein
VSAQQVIDLGVQFFSRYKEISSLGRRQLSQADFQSDEFFWRKRLGAPVGTDARAFQRLDRFMGADPESGGSQSIFQGLSALAEGRCDESKQPRFVVRRMTVGCREADLDNLGIHLRRREKGHSADMTQVFCRGAVSEHGRNPSIFFAAGGSCQSGRQLALEHQHSPLYVPAGVD